MTNMSLLPMMCYENSEEEKNENGGDENKQESTNPEDGERTADHGTARNTEEPQGTPLMQLYIRTIFTTGITSEWATSTIEDNLANPRVTRSVLAWIESFKARSRREKSKYDQCAAGS